MAHTPTRSRPHADFRHRAQSPLPAVEAVDQRLVALLSPSLLAPRQMARRAPRQPQRVSRLRQRLLTRPVLVAIVVSLGWRRMPAVTEGQRVLARAGLLWVTPLRGSPPALIKRLDVLPAAVLGQLCAEVGARWQAQQSPAWPQPGGAPVRAAVSLRALGDGSPREALRKKTQVVRECQGLVWGGKMLVMVEAFSHRPLWQLDTADAAAKDQRCGPELRAARPVGGLWVFERELLSFLWLDACTAAHRFFVTRMREQSA